MNSPVKKKSRKNCTNEPNRQCIIHVRAEVKNQLVTMFSEKSWQVKTLILFYFSCTLFRYCINCKSLVRVLYVYLKHGMICILDCTQCFRDERRSSVGLLWWFAWCFKIWLPQIMLSKLHKFSSFIKIQERKWGNSCLSQK